MQPMIRRTVTQKVRTFLEAQGIALRPWSGLDETYGELHELLSRRRDDPSFWGPLSQLMQAILDDVTHPRAAQRVTAAQAELLHAVDEEGDHHVLKIGSARVALPEL